MLKDISIIEQRYEDKIGSVIISSINESKNYTDIDKIKIIWEQAEKKIIDLIYDMLEKIYTLILKFIKNCYPEAKLSKINIKSLTWNLDGKTLEERVQSYCTYAIDTLSLGLKEKELIKLKELLIYDFIRIIETEDKVILNQILKKQVAKYYKYVIIFNGSCECCNVEERVQLVKDFSRWPPLHPRCDCVPILLTEEEKLTF